MGCQPGKMSKPKLTYFDVRARGELSRLVMAAAKKDYEDVRVSFEEWGEMKPKTEFGTLPVLTVNGVDYFQGNAIATYLARENGLYGSTNLEGLMIDQIVHLKEDLLQEEAKIMFGTEESKAEAAKKVTGEVYPRVFKIFENLAKRSKTGYVAGTKLSLGDIAIFEGTQNCFQNNPKILDEFPTIKAVREKVAAADGIKQYLAKRKQTPL